MGAESPRRGCGSAMTRQYPPLRPWYRPGASSNSDFTIASSYTNDSACSGRQQCASGVRPGRAHALVPNGLPGDQTADMHPEGFSRSALATRAGTQRLQQTWEALPGEQQQRRHVQRTRQPTQIPAPMFQVDNMRGMHARAQQPVPVSARAGTRPWPAGSSCPPAS